MSRYIILLFTAVMLITASFLFGGCTNNCVGVYIKRPAEIDINKFKKIGVGDIVDKMGFASQHTVELYENLLIMLNKNKYLEVFDKSRIRTPLEDKNTWRTQRDLISENEAGKMYANIGAMALITGRIRDDDYSENLTVSDPKINSSDTTKRYITKQVEGTYTLTLFIKIISLDSSALILSRIFSVKKSAGSEIDLDFPKNKHKMPPDINKEELFRQCMNDILSQFEPLLTPHEIYKSVCFKINKDEMPESEQAVDLLRNNQWQPGTELFRQTINKPNLSSYAKAQAYYNYGMALLYRGRFDEAIVQFNNAIRLDPKEPDYVNALDETNFELKNAQKLNEQIK